MKKSELIFTALLVPLDFLMLILAGLSAYALRTSNLIVSLRPVLFNINLPLGRYLELVFVVALFWLIIFALNGLYAIKNKPRALEEFFKIFAAISTGLIGVIIYIFIRHEFFDSRFIILAAWFLAILYVVLARFLMKKIQGVLMSRYGLGVHRVLVIGNDSVTENILKEIKQKPSLGYRLVKHLKDLNMDHIRPVVNNPCVDDIILAGADFPREKVLRLIDFCEDEHLNFKFVPNLFQALTSNIEMDVLAAVPLVELKRTSLNGWGQIIKRIIDVGGAVFGLIVLSPLFIFISLIIKADSPGPVLVKLKRISQGKEFDLFKFRSMVYNAEALKKDLLKFNERKDGPLFKMKNDPRVTRVGKFLRRTRLDEFPQLFNVLKGEMSLVGPRPHQPDEVSQYQRHHKKVLAIKPGITGLAQISGSSDLHFNEEVKLDSYYIEKWSLIRDFKILLKTLAVLFTDKSAC